jgi:hypothetical protein
VLGHPRLEGGERLDHVCDHDLDPLDIQHLTQCRGPVRVEQRRVELGRELSAEDMDEGRAAAGVGREIAHYLAVVELLPQPISGREFVAGHG